MKRNFFWRWVGVAILGLLVYVGLLVVFAPAQYFTPYITQLSRGAATIEQPSGTLWNGSGLLVLRVNPQPMGQLQWTVHPWRLFTGSLVADLQLTGNDTEVRGTVEAGLQRLSVREVVVSGPAHAIGLFFPAAEMMGLGGRVRLNTATFEIGAQELRGSVELLWEDASSRLLPVTETGNYKLQLTGQGKHAALQLSTIQGVLQIAGQGEWRALEDGMLRFQGTLTPTTPQPTLEPMLNMLGPAQADGRRSFNIERRLALSDISVPAP